MNFCEVYSYIYLPDTVQCWILLSLFMDKYLHMYVFRSLVYVSMYACMLCTIFEIIYVLTYWCFYIHTVCRSPGDSSDRSPALCYGHSRFGCEAAVSLGGGTSQVRALRPISETRVDGSCLLTFGILYLDCTSYVVYVGHNDKTVDM